MNEIIEYAIRTPHNTNPAVLESIINQNMNRVLDLDKYGITNVLEELLVQEGGTWQASDGYVHFWSDVKEINPDVVQFTSDGVRFECKNPVLFSNFEVGTPYGFSIEMFVIDRGPLLRISTAFTASFLENTPAGLMIAMVVQPMGAI